MVAVVSQKVYPGGATPDLEQFEHVRLAVADSNHPSAAGQLPSCLERVYRATINLRFALPRN
jgi:hypothetical protein